MDAGVKESKERQVQFQLEAVRLWLATVQEVIAEIERRLERCDEILTNDRSEEPSDG